MTIDHRLSIMNLVRSIIIAVAATIISSPSGLSQEVTKTGTTAAKFLSIPVGARAVGMGGAFVAVANDVSAMYWNPGGIARMTQSEAVFSHASWIADMSFNYGAVAVPLDFGTVGVSFTSLSMAEMERTTEDQPDGTGQTFSAGSFAVGVAYAKSLTEWFSIGGNVKYVNEHIWNSSATAIAIDVGTLFTTPFPGVKFGVGISNFGQKMQITGDDLIVQKDISLNNGNNPNVDANLSTDQFDLPLILRIGVSYDVIATEDNELLLAVDAAHPNDNSETVSLGTEYSLLHKMLAIRFGYRDIGASQTEESFSLGGGFIYEIQPGTSFKFDYAFQKFGLLENVHKFSVGFLF